MSDLSPLYDECLLLCVPENLLKAYEGLPEKSESPKIPFILPGRMAREAKGCTVYPAPDGASFGFYFAVPRYHEEEPEFDYALKKAREILSPQASLAV